nr:hypothetical protein 8 [bacterium]
MAGKHANITAVYGMRGSGKSVLARSLMRKHKRVIVFDVVSEFYEEGMKGVQCGNDPLRSIREFEQLVISQGVKKSYKLSFSIGLMNTQEKWKLFDLFCGWLLHFQNTHYKSYGKNSPVLLVAEEMSACAPHNKHQPRFNAIIGQGRHIDISVLGITQRPKCINTTFSAQADEVFCFKLSKQSDIKEVFDQIPNSKTVISRYNSMKKFYYMKLDRDKNVTFLRTRR